MAGMNDKIICIDCKWQGETEDVLKGYNPFEKGMTIYGCPRCKAIEKFSGACDQDGCWKVSTCGFPTEEGYRRSCSEHLTTYEGKL